jgi:hypothetical protein
MYKYIIIFLLLITILTIGNLWKEGYENKATRNANYLKKDVSKDSKKNPESKNSITKYNSDNYDMEYHDTVENIIKQNDLDNNESKTFNVIDPSGNRVKIPWSNVKGNITYNEPGTLRFGPSNYVPNYEDSVYLSRLTGLSYTKPIYDTASQLGGFCSFNKNSNENTETSCLKLDKNTCASTTCCVLLGGAKCVAGNKNGPIMKSNYNDVYLRNKDFYYYQGKCYGNCRD